MSTTTATGGYVIVSPSSGSGPSEAMKRCARKIQEKLCSNHKQTKKPLKRTKDKNQIRSPKKQSQNHNHIKRRACNIGRKGKTYKTKDDRKLTEISAEKHFARNYLRCSKPGGRNSRSAFRMRNLHSLGTGLGPGQVHRRRLDRPWSFFEEDERGYL